MGVIAFDALERKRQRRCATESIRHALDLREDECGVAVGLSFQHRDRKLTQLVILCQVLFSATSCFSFRRSEVRTPVVPLGV